MGRALAMDLRTRVLAAYDAGGCPQQDVADQYAVGVATVKRWVRLRRETGLLVPRKPPGASPRLDLSGREALLHLLQEQPDLTIPEYVEELSLATGVLVSTSTMSRAILALGWTRKKNGPRSRA